MRSNTILTTLVAILLTANFVIAQDFFGEFGGTQTSSEAGQFNFSIDSVDIRTVQQSGSASAGLFKPAPQSTAIPPVATQSNAQQEIVLNTLRTIGTALLVSLIVIGTFLYSKKRRNRSGDHWGKEAQW